MRTYLCRACVVCSVHACVMVHPRARKTVENSRVSQKTSRMVGQSKNMKHVNFGRKMTPSPKKLSCPPKIFLLFFQKMLFSSKKLLDEKIFQTTFPMKKVIFIFITRRPLSFKRDLVPRNILYHFLEKYSFF